ncbi:MAG: exonuclease SbcCD subunit D [Candidatus Epulonipiscioides saccharophilum]|nr:MAG: exonuclease SbcCD subunit D [Epulopiscium sp. AS2M-Bin001]
MRILHTSDWHLGKTLSGYSRMEEQEEFLKDFVQLAYSNNVDLVIIAGDIFDSSDPPPKAEAMFYNTLEQLSKNGERLVLVIAGNHDNPNKLVVANPFTKKHGIIVVGKPKTIVPEGLYGQHYVKNSGEGFIEIDVNGEKAVILIVPYPSEKRLNEIVVDNINGGQAQSYVHRMRTLFQKGSEKYRSDTINLAVSHLFSSGNELDCISLGKNCFIPGKYFPPKAQYIALGHIHKSQIVPGTNNRARYSGSPIHYTKQHLDEKKLCLLVDVKVGQDCSVTELPLKIYKPIEIWSCDSVAAAIEKCELNQSKNCWVYLRIKTDRPILNMEKNKMKSIKNDIINIFPVFPDQSLLDENFDPYLLAEEQNILNLFKAFYLKRTNNIANDDTIALFNSFMEEV